MAVFWRATFAPDPMEPVHFHLGPEGNRARLARAADHEFPHSFGHRKPVWFGACWSVSAMDRRSGRVIRFAGIGSRLSDSAVLTAEDEAPRQPDRLRGAILLLFWRRSSYFLNERTCFTSALISSSLKVSPKPFILVLSPSLTPSLMAFTNASSLNLACTSALV